MIGIYKITNPKNNIYIGQSTNIKKRWNHYNFKDCKSQSALYNSFNKYGVVNHIFEVIEECDITVLNEKEGYWQDYYDSVNKGLNCRRVSSLDKTGYLSQETKDKISLANKGRIYSEKVLISIKNFRKNRVVTNETRLKMSNSAKNKIISEELKFKISRIVKEKISKKVIDIKTKQIYNSCNEASISIGVNCKTLSKWLTGTRKNKSNLMYLENYTND